MSKIIHSGTRIGGAVILAGLGGSPDTPSAGPSVRTSPVARAALRSA
jgi:hypothetical protein